MAGFTIIDNDEVLNNEDLSPMEKLTLIYLIKFNNELKGYAYPSLEVLKNILAYSHTRYVIKIINSLVKKGYIKKETVKQKNRYYILRGKVQNVPKGRVQNVPKGRVQNVPTKSIKKSIKKNNIYISLKFIDEVIDKVKITQEQYYKLISKFNKDIIHKNIVELDNYITNGNGGEYKEHYRVLNTWCTKANSSNSSIYRLKQVADSWSGMKQFN